MKIYNIILTFPTTHLQDSKTLLNAAVFVYRGGGDKPTSVDSIDLSSGRPVTTYLRYYVSDGPATVSELKRRKHFFLDQHESL